MPRSGPFNNPGGIGRLPGYRDADVGVTDVRGTAAPVIRQLPVNRIDPRRFGEETRPPTIDRFFTLNAGHRRRLTYGLSQVIARQADAEARVGGAQDMMTAPTTHLPMDAGPATPLSCQVPRLVTRAMPGGTP